MEKKQTYRKVWRVLATTEKCREVRFRDKLLRTYIPWKKEQTFLQTYFFFFTMSLSNSIPFLFLRSISIIWSFSFWNVFNRSAPAKKKQNQHEENRFSLLLLSRIQLTSTGFFPSAIKTFSHIEIYWKWRREGICSFCYKGMHSSGHTPRHRIYNNAPNQPPILVECIQDM